MRPHHAFSRLRPRPNPYPAHLTQRVTLRLDRETVTHLRALAAEVGLPFQSLINLHLRDCAVRGKRLAMRRARPRTEA